VSEQRKHWYHAGPGLPQADEAQSRAVWRDAIGRIAFEADMGKSDLAKAIRWEGLSKSNRERWRAIGEAVANAVLGGLKP
jgi:hypothetical protein